MDRPRALNKIGPPWPSKVHHLQPWEARDIWQYVEHLEMLNEHGQDLATAVISAAETDRNRASAAQELREYLLIEFAREGNHATNSD